MAKDAYYFSHDSNARYDSKILAMRSVYGIEGYGRYWILVEVLREQEGYKLEKHKHLFNALAMQMQCDADAVQCFVEDCINEFDLVQEDENFIWIDSLINRMEMKDKKSEKARKAAKVRWKKSSDSKGSDDSEEDSNADAMQTHSERKALKESKGKESKGKESKGNINNSRKSKIYDEDSIPYQLALRLYKKILENNSAFKEPNLQKWADDVRLMIERDNRTEKQIAYLIDWVQNDSFWKSNILSIDKLRKQFDRLAIKVKEEQNKIHQPRGQVVNMPYAYQSMQDWANEEGET